MNILTFDIEEWYLESILSGGRIEKYRRFDNILNAILESLDTNNLKATFFCLGAIASDFSEVVKKIDRCGHEVACHSNKHLWLTKMNPDEMYEDTRLALDKLEQCIGKKVLSYRAPAFSITEKNAWAFEVLAECGIERDASVFPATRDFGGFSKFGHIVPSIVRFKGIIMKEFPISTTKILGKEIAYSGGGYFRLFPLFFIKKMMTYGCYSMSYFHVQDLIQDTNRFMSREGYENYFKEHGTLMNRSICA